MSYVKCAICGETFDKDKVPCVKHNAKRYSHYNCEPDKELYVPNISKEDMDKKELQNYIIKLFNFKSCGPRINKEIKNFHDDLNFSYENILKALKWWYEIEKHPIDRYQGSIAIVEYIYYQALNYYNCITFVTNVNQNKNIKAFIQPPIKQVIIPSPHVEIKPKKLFNIE